ncbi:MAG: PhoH family protein [Bifidobacteriaceae bacterium]|nr:PhoH family protein [Bifidobacteriaceae bacterium]
MATSTRTITIPAELDPVVVCGPADQIIRQVEDAFPDLTIIVRGNRIAIMSRSKQTEADALKAQTIIQRIIDAAYTAPYSADDVTRLLASPYATDPDVPARGTEAGESRIHATYEHAREHTRKHHGATTSIPGVAVNADGVGWAKDPFEDTSVRVPGVIAMARGVPVRPKTAGQVAYVNAIETHTITFAIGPAGTGKTYLAVAKAVRAFEDGEVRRIILTRPAVEAGEKLGFLPGTLSDKVDPYLRPLYDALSDMIGGERVHKYLTDGTIEVAPLAYMRGRTLNDAYVILDEAQNTTAQQMKMFLTRLGFNTRMVITGDITQVDFEVRQSGLARIEDVLGGIDDIAFVHLDTRDVVRHALVGAIVRAYDSYAASHRDSHQDSRGERPAKEGTR